MAEQIRFSEIPEINSKQSFPFGVSFSKSEENKYCVYFGEDIINIEHYKKAYNALEKFLKNKKLLKQIEYNNTKIKEKYKQEEEQKFRIGKSQKEELIEGYIYVIKSTKHYKIGRTLKPKQRIKKYVTENPDEIEVILCEKVKDYIEVEKNLHWILKHKNHNREWFNLNDVDLHIVEDYIEGKKYGNI